MTFEDLEKLIKKYKCPVFKDKEVLSVAAGKYGDLFVADISDIRYNATDGVFYAITKNDRRASVVEKKYI